jgi:beta-ribofuranosylaminobenzene 5'-phosphate synthase
MKPSPHLAAIRAEVAVPARLHLGFLDLDGGSGRRWGSFGITLDGIETRLTAAPAEGIHASGPSAERAAGFARQIAASLDLPGGIEITLQSVIPEHAGLGSGTQLGLAVGAAFAGLYGLDLGARAIAMTLGRGARSGIGIGAFEQGGVLVDGGRLEGANEPAPIVSRMEFPDAWRIVLVLDGEARGLHGAIEAEAFQKLRGFAPELSAHLCRLVLMAALPALAERDFPSFAAAVAEIQNAVGDHFAPVQGGRYASPAVAQVLSWFESEGWTGIGQSSWGPTGFALVENAAAADALVAAAKGKWAGDGRLAFMICRGRNRGGRADLGFSMAAASESHRR